MPLYDYECQTCRRVFESFQTRPIGNASMPCPYCRGNGHKIMSRTHFRLRGGGWAKDNYSKKEG